jgi:hypothetical protein
MSNGNGFGIGDLSGTAKAVGAGADGLGGMPAPDLPDAGVSSASVAGALGAMSAVISNVVGTAAAARQRVTVNQQSYQDTDRYWRSVFTEDGEGTR